MDKYSAQLAALKIQAAELAPILHKLKNRAENDPFHDGISLLSVKFYTLLEYIADLSFFCLFKLSSSADSCPPSVLERLVENRLIIEKIKPIEQRMKYQIDSLVRSALTSQPSELSLQKTSTTSELLSTDSLNDIPPVDDDSYSYKPKIQSLVASAKADGILLPNNQDPASSEAYQPPKLVPLHFEEDSSLKKRREKAESRMKERSNRSQIIKDLVSEFDNRPETSSSWGTSSAIGVAATDKLEAARLERATYEEDNFIRMTESKKQKKLYRQGFKRLDDEFSGLSNYAAISRLQNANASSNVKNKMVLEKRKPSSSNNSQSALDKPSNKKLKTGKFQARKRKA
ncbi:hypothetical protein BB561_003735 [Smittium simulii]|uniref:Neuroguidin n=1 Tax=Smittium simulii TaxID=133385 RepID=A0A2T9YJT3_9FUNG|nr:hypothetical protein BB561_003735 [Smittium simulii]